MAIARFTFIMLTDLIIATVEDVPAILKSQGHASVWPTLEAKGIDQVKLSRLRFILMDLPPEDESVIQYMNTFEVLADGGEGGPWIQVVPDDLTNLLGQISRAELAALAKAWADTEEAMLDQWSSADVEPFLGELSSLAASAVVQGKSLLLWVCA